jgi:hypothetical protein
MLVEKELRTTIHSSYFQVIFDRPKKKFRSNFSSSEWSFVMQR